MKASMEKVTISAEPSSDDGLLLWMWEVDGMCEIGSVIVSPHPDKPHHFVVAVKLTGHDETTSVVDSRHWQPSST